MKKKFLSALFLAGCAGSEGAGSVSSGAGYKLFGQHN